MNRVSEAELERIGELAKAVPSDPLAAREWINRARSDLTLLVEALTDQAAATGGEFANRLREALEPRILVQLNGRAQLTAATTEHSLSVHLGQDAVWVDVRLRLGVAK